MLSTLPITACWGALLGNSRHLNPNLWPNSRAPIEDERIRYSSGKYGICHTMATPENHLCPGYSSLTMASPASRETPLFCAKVDTRYPREQLAKMGAFIVHSSSNVPGMSWYKLVQPPRGSSCRHLRPLPTCGGLGSRMRRSC